MIKKIKESYPDSKLDLIGSGLYGVDQLMSGSDLIDNYLHLPHETTWAEKVRFFSRLKREKYNGLLIPFDASPFFLNKGASLIGASRIIRHYISRTGLLHQVNDWRKRMFGHNTTWVQAVPGRHEIDLNFDLLDAFLVKPVQRNYNTFVQVNSDPETLGRFDIPSSNYIVLQPDAANGIYNAKVWHKDNFIRLIQLLMDETSAHIVIVGDQGDNERTNREIEQQFGNNSRLVNTSGATSIIELLNILKNASMVVCHDSAVMHLADAMDIPMLALYGPTDYERTKPLRSNSQVLFSEGEFLGAMAGWKTTEKKLSAYNENNRIMSGIQVAEVSKKDYAAFYVGDYRIKLGYQATPACRE